MARRRPGKPIRYRKGQQSPRSKQAAKRHARQRAEERYGADLTDGDLQQLVRLVQRRRGRLLETQEGGRQLWLLEYGGQRLPVIYDPAGATLVSVLPAEHASVAAHIAAASADRRRDPRLAQLKEAAAGLDLPEGPVRIGALAVHQPSGVQGEVLEADMSTRTLTVRVGATGRLRDLISCFAGPALR